VTKARAPRPKHRKAVRKANNVHIRVSDEQKKAIEEAALRASLTVSSWILTAVLRVLKEDAEAERKKMSG